MSPQRHYLVTGVTHGIGHAVVDQLLAKGHQVTILDRDPSQQTHWIALNLADPASIQAAIAELSGSIHGLINCAGIAPSDDNQRAVLAINWLGTRTLTESVLSRLTDDASVVTIASRAGDGWTEHCDMISTALPEIDIDQLAERVSLDALTPARAYELSKELLIVWTLQMAGNAQGIRFNTISPSSVDTRLTPAFKAAFQSRQTHNRSLVSRVATTTEVAAAACFLASPEASWINGVDLKVDGGVTAKRLLTRWNLENSET